MSPYELLPCRWRRPSPFPGRQHCTSPIVNPGPFGVMHHQCWMCADRDHLDQSAPAPAADKAGSVRHLLFHLYPTGERWKWHMGILRQHMSLFNGRRIVSVAVGQGTADVDQVRAELACDGVEFVQTKNDPAMKELVSYPYLVARLERYRGPGDCHFYAHGKGVVSEDMGPACRRWTAAMYEALLGHWPAVRAALQDHCCVGIFRRLWSGPLRTHAKWHYSGSFRWVRNADFYAREWRRIDPNWLGAEVHIGLMFGRGESCCLYGEFDTTDIGLYAEPEWDRWAEPRRREWVESHRLEASRPLLGSVILTSHRQPDLVHQAIASVRAQTTDAWQLLIVDSGELSAAGAFERYRDDARISVMQTGETADHRARLGIQAWAVNEAMRRGGVLGDLVCVLSDDDYFAPSWLQEVGIHALDDPDQDAWVGWADRRELSADGQERQLGQLIPRGVGGRGCLLRGQVDGMQVCVRRRAWVDWPEDRELAAEADGHWMDALALVHPVLPINAYVGVHRHTPLSTFTRPARGSA